jgi:transcriptional regulator with XRE-family HTH domain
LILSLIVTDQKILTELGKKLASKRKLKGLTQEELAHSVGMEKSNYNVIENGKSNPQILTLIKICCALECELGEILQIGSEGFIEAKKTYIPRKHKKK